VHFDSYGAKDVSTGAPVAPDTIWGIASMTKPVTGVAMIILHEEGRWKLDDPVHKHTPSSGTSTCAVKLMRTKVLRPGVKVDLYGLSQEGVGFGMDFAVIMDPNAAMTPQGKDRFYWGGAFGIWLWIGPTDDLGPWA
jgi:CubicO group peptidase (beta-lactamase class C family)